MDFSINADHQAIRDGVGAVVRSFGDDYWLARDDDAVLLLVSAAILRGIRSYFSRNPPLARNRTT